MKMEAFLLASIVFPTLLIFTLIGVFFALLFFHVKPGESITGDMISKIQMTDNNPAKNYWLKFETLTDNETIWELPNRVE